MWESLADKMQTASGFIRSTHIQSYLGCGALAMECLGTEYKVYTEHSYSTAQLPASWSEIR